jgi:hypothetical protein
MTFKCHTTTYIYLQCSHNFIDCNDEWMLIGESIWTVKSVITTMLSMHLINMLYDLHYSWLCDTVKIAEIDEIPKTRQIHNSTHNAMPYKFRIQTNINSNTISQTNQARSTLVGNGIHDRNLLSLLNL